MAVARCSIGNRTYDFEPIDGLSPGQKVWVNTARGETKARFVEYADEPTFDGDLQPVLRTRDEDEEE